uniref:Uncharacterized protein n=1 Tax=Meloidogyne incognita TaxID=6306 RepID=A0A914KLW4_MELIC
MPFYQQVTPDITKLSIYSFSYILFIIILTALLIIIKIQHGDFRHFYFPLIYEENEGINYTEITRLQNFARIEEVEEIERKEEEVEKEEKEVNKMTEEELKEKGLIEEMNEDMIRELKGEKSKSEEKNIKNEGEDKKKKMNNDETKKNMNEEEENKKEIKGEEEKNKYGVKEEVKVVQINDEVKKRVMIGGIGMDIQMEKEEMIGDKGKINNEVDRREEEEEEINSDEILTESTLKERIENEQNNQEHNTSNNFCEGENMAYNVSYGGDSNTPGYFLTGKKFDCSLLSHLKRYKLTDRWNSGIDDGVNEGDKMRISYPHSMTGTPFVLAANFKFYPSLRAIIDGIRRYFIRNIQIIVYDLGGLSDDKFI